MDQPHPTTPGRAGQPRTTTKMNYTDSELKDLRDRIESLESEADSLDEKASDRLEDLRDEGVNPLTDEDAHETLTDLDKRASKRRDKAAALRDRYEEALKERKARGDDNPGRDFLTTVDNGDDDNRATAASIGHRFIDTDEYVNMRDAIKAGRPLEDVVARMPSVEVTNRTEARALLTRDVNAGVLEDEDRKGMIGESHAYRPVRVLQVITTGETDDATIEYVAEDAPTEAADFVDYDESTAGAGDSLPESTYSFSEQSVNVHRVGHYVPATERQLADTAGLGTLLDTRLRGGLRRKLESLVVSGDTAAGDNFDGIYNAGNLNSLAKDAGDTRYDAAMKAKTKVRLASEGLDEPTVVGLHPNDWEAIVLEKDADGNYLNRRGANEPSMIFGLRPLVSTAFTEGEPLIGDYSGAFLWMRTGISVTSSDSHSDWFLKGWIAMKAQFRAAFATVIGRKFTHVTQWNN